MTTAAPSAPSSSGGPLAALLSGIGLVAVVAALPVVVLMGGPIGGWVLGAVLWVVNWGISLGIARKSMGLTATAAVGVSGVSFIARAWLVALVLFIVALRYSEEGGLTAAGVFLAAFTFDVIGRTFLYASRARAPRGPTS